MLLFSRFPCFRFWNILHHFQLFVRKCAQNWQTTEKNESGLWKASNYWVSAIANPFADLKCYNQFSILDKIHFPHDGMIIDNLIKVGFRGLVSFVWRSFAFEESGIISSAYFSQVTCNFITFSDQKTTRGHRLTCRVKLWEKTSWKLFLARCTYDFMCRRWDWWTGRKIVCAPENVSQLKIMLNTSERILKVSQVDVYVGYHS